MSFSKNRMSWTIILAEIRHALELPTSVQIRYSENKPAKNGAFVLFETKTLESTPLFLLLSQPTHQFSHPQTCSNSY